MNATVAKRIVVGYDGSGPAQRALDRVAELAGYGTSVTVVTAAPAMYGEALPPLADPDDVARAERLLEEARERLARRHVAVATREAVGNAAAQIVRAASELEADLVVVGTRNGNAVQRLVLGSTSTKVLHEAPCDVLVVR